MRGGGGGVVGGGSNLRMGVPNNHGPGGAGGAGDRRPSKLMMMREDYHKKILKEKEEKMVQMYEDSQTSQKKAMMRMMRGGSGEGSANGTMANGGSGASVRDFFNERRRLEATGAPVPPIDDHFRQAKGYSSPGGWSSRTGSGNSAKKCSAGRDRSQPLAPIQRPKDTREMARTGNTPRGGDRLANGQPPPAAEPNPFNARPKLVKHKPLPPTNGYASKYLNKRLVQQEDDGYELEMIAHQGIDTRQTFQPPQQQQEQHITDNNNNDKQRQQAAPSQSKFGYQGLHQQRNVQQYRHQPQPQLIKNNNHQQQQQQQQQSPQRQQPHPPPQRQQPHPPPQQYEEPSPPQPPSQRPSPKHHPQNRAGYAGKLKPPSQPKPAAQTKPHRPNQRQQGEPKMTDFQKWQMEQNKTREERLKKLNTQNKNDAEQGHWDSPGDENDDDEDEGDYGGHNNRGDNRYGEDRNNDEEEDGEEDGGDDDDDDGQENEVKRMERELLEKIEREKAELDRIRHEKALAEEEEKREIEENKKREKLEKIKMKKLEEQRKKEEQQRRREEEEDERRERQREDKERREREREEEKRRREEDKRRKEDEKVTARREKEELKRLAKLQKQQQGKESSRSMSQGPSSYNDDDYDDTPAQSSRRSPVNSGLTLGEIDELPAVASAGDSSYYAKIAKSSEAKGSVGSLAKCKICGRSFAVDRLKKHQVACTKANKPRKEFDSSKKRVEGTEQAKYVDRPRKEPPKKKNNWRSQHEEFINSLRYAKKAAQYEKEGKDIRQLTPPPTKENPDLVACPYCNRTFNETAAERHIPRCKDLKTKPPPMKTKRR